MNKWLSLAVGSLAGGFSRYFVAGFAHEILGTQFPYGTLIVNLTGCFLIGLFDSWTGERFLLGMQSRMLLMTGFCGAYTTFSSFILETSSFARGGQMGRALAYIIVSVVAGFLIFRLGCLLGEAI